MRSGVEVPGVDLGTGYFHVGFFEVLGVYIQQYPQKSLSNATSSLHTVKIVEKTINTYTFIAAAIK